MVELCGTLNGTTNKLDFLLLSEEGRYELKRIALELELEGKSLSESEWCSRL